MNEQRLFQIQELNTSHNRTLTELNNHKLANYVSNVHFGQLSQLSHYVLTLLLHYKKFIKYLSHIIKKNKGKKKKIFQLGGIHEYTNFVIITLNKFTNR